MPVQITDGETENVHNHTEYGIENIYTSHIFSLNAQEELTPSLISLAGKFLEQEDTFKKTNTTCPSV